MCWILSIGPSKQSTSGETFLLHEILSPRKLTICTLKIKYWERTISMLIFYHSYFIFIPEITNLKLQGTTAFYSNSYLTVHLTFRISIIYTLLLWSQMKSHCFTVWIVVVSIFLWGDNLCYMWHIPYNHCKMLVNKYWYTPFVA